ncbi:MAG: hypothetical protein ACP5J2_09395, partial [Caldisericum sp.]
LLLGREVSKKMRKNDLTWEKVNPEDEALILKGIEKMRSEIGTWRRANPENEVFVFDDYGDCFIIRMPNGHCAIFDRAKKRLLVYTKFSYGLDFYWDEWLRRGIVLLEKKESMFRSNYYILNARTMKPITRKKIIGFHSDWFLDGKSDYFVVKDAEKKEAIFTFYGRVSDWYDEVDYSGLLVGTSNYYIATKNGKQAVFDNYGNRIVGLFDKIYYSGLVKGKSSYSVVEKKGKMAIFDDNNRQISGWFDRIEPEGLVRGQSDYYLVTKSFRGVTKQAIFDKDKNQITDWHDSIDTKGLVKGRSPYYMTTETNNEESLIYVHKAGSRKVMGPFKEVQQLDEYNDVIGFIDDPTKNQIIVTMLDGAEKWITKEEADEFFDQEEYKEI